MIQAGKQNEDIPSHVVATFLELDHSLATMAPLPAQLLRLVEKPAGLLVPRTIPGPVPLAVAGVTDLGIAAATLGKLASVYVAVDVLRFDPFAAAPRRAVDAVLRRVLGILPVPLLLEAGVEKPLDVLQRDMISVTALGRHVLGISDGEPKALFQATVAHPMTTPQFCCLVSCHLIIHADDALDPCHVSGPVP